MSDGGTRTFLCGARRSLAGRFTYRSGGWPFVQATVTNTELRVRPAYIPLLVLTLVGMVLAIGLGRWQLWLLALAIPVAIVGTPRRTFPLSDLTARRATVGIASRALEVASGGGTNRIWLWFMSRTAFEAELRNRGVVIHDANEGIAALDL